MDNTKKIAMFLLLFVGLSACAFAETFYSFYTGLFRISEHYFDDNYGREVDGINFNTNINHYPEGSSFGWFITGTVGGGLSGFEWTEDKMSPLDIYSSTDLRLGFGPSYKIVSGSTFTVPVSLGAVFSNYREEGYYYYDYDDSGEDDEDYHYYGYSSDMSFYEAINIGLAADAVILITPCRWLALRTGISVAWDFLRFERGNMYMNYRSTNGGQFKYISYGALNFSVYSGVGLRF